MASHPIPEDSTVQVEDYKVHTLTTLKVEYNFKGTSKHSSCLKHVQFKLCPCENTAPQCSTFETMNTHFKTHDTLIQCFLYFLQHENHVFMQQSFQS
jgi:hypothetical protein